MTIKLADFQLRGGAGTGQVTLTLAHGGHHITINGLTFVGHPEETTPANREFYDGGTLHQTIVHMTRVLNHPKFGIPKVNATNDGNLTITLTPSNGRRIHISNASPKITLGEIEDTPLTTVPVEHHGDGSLQFIGPVGERHVIRGGTPASFLIKIALGLEAADGPYRAT